MKTGEWAFLGFAVLLGAWGLVYTLREIRREGHARRAAATCGVFLILIVLNLLGIFWPFSPGHTPGLYKAIIIGLNILILLVPRAWYLNASFAVGALAENRILHRARRLIRRGKVTSAIDLLEKAIAKENSPYLHNDLALAYEAQDDIVQAEQHYRKAVEMAPGETMFAENLESLIQESEHGSK